VSEICQQSHILFNGLPRYWFPFDELAIPSNGIYILFEKGEFAHDVDRIVRVGTHTGANQLRSRLKQHFVNENKDRSIFRKNIGRALLRRADDPFLEQWNWDLTTRRAKEKYLLLLDKDKQRQVERAVTEYIQTNFSFVVFSVDTKKERLEWERKIISAVSWCQECCPSSNWLGMHSPKKKIRKSGLWLVQGLYKEGLSWAELEELKEVVQANTGYSGRFARAAEPPALTLTPAFIAAPTPVNHRYVVASALAGDIGDIEERLTSPRDIHASSCVINICAHVETVCRESLQGETQ